MGGLWVLPPPPALASLLSARPWLVVTAGGFWDGERRHPAQRRGGRGDCDWQGRPVPAPLPPGNLSAPRRPRLTSHHTCEAGATPPHGLRDSEEAPGEGLVQVGENPRARGAGCTPKPGAPRLLILLPAEVWGPTLVLPPQGLPRRPVHAEATSASPDALLPLPPHPAPGGSPETGSKN